MTAQQPAIDPVTVEVVRHRLRSICVQSATNIVRTAYSILIYEYKDFAVGLIDRQGRLIAQGSGGIPVFSANLLGLAVADGVKMYGEDGFVQGDVAICNYAGVLGQHLNNVVMYTPIFSAGPEPRLLAFMAIATHWADVGGRVVGSHTAHDTTEIFQEGIQFRSVKLVAAGKRVEEIYRMIEFNTRFPAMVLGDVAAQLAGCLAGRDLFAEMVAEFGAATVRGAIETIWSQSEAAARAFVRAIPDGLYEAEGFIDDDGVTKGVRIEMPIAVRVAADTLTIDYSRVSPQLKGPFNSGAHGGGITAARMAFNFLLNPEDGPNDGLYRPLAVVLPPGKFLSADANAAMGRYNAPLATVIDVVIRALAPVLPEAAAAGHHGNIGGHHFVGHDPLTGKLFKNQETSVGGWGALNGMDGPGPFKTYVHGDTFGVPAELQEALYPLRMEEFALRPDSGGAGRFRGGLGIVKTYRALAECRLQVNFDRVDCPAWGLNGGDDGAAARVTIKRRNAEAQMVKRAALDLRPGDTVTIETGGGGGYGPPHDRAREAIARDIALGYVSAEAARAIYGFGKDPQ
jgi:N-methylhydantoinase B